MKQVLEEYDIALKYRNPRITQSWHPNEDLYFDRKKKQLRGRHNYRLGEMQGFVDTLLSKIDDQPNLEFQPIEEADVRKAEKVTKLWEVESSIQHEDWGYKDLLGKKGAALYGRAIYQFYGESEPEYKSNLELVDPYDFLIDHNTGGEDTENAMYMGIDNIFKQIDDFVDDDRYDQKNVLDIKNGTSEENKGEDNDNELKEKANRLSILGLNDSEPVKGKFKFRQWYTTFEGTRYLVFYETNSKTPIRVEKLKEIFTTKHYENGDPLFPIDSWATNPDAFEFWTPAPADQVRDIILAKSDIINQALDNRMYNNFGMKAYDTKMFPNPALLEPRWAGVVPVKTKGQNIQNGIYEFKYPALGDTTSLWGVLDNEKAKNSGIGGSLQGVNEEDKKVGIMEGELAQAADRLGLYNRSYGRFWIRMGIRYINGLKEHLDESMAIRMTGESGVNFTKVVKDDLTEFDINVTGLQAEARANARQEKLQFDTLISERGNPLINQPVLEENILEIAGFEKNEIYDLMDTQNQGQKEILAIAEEENQKMLEEDVEPNKGATTMHIRRHIDYLNANEFKSEVEDRIQQHLAGEMDFARKNMAKAILQERAEAPIAPEQGKPTGEVGTPQPNVGGANPQRQQLLSNV